MAVAARQSGVVSLRQVAELGLAPRSFLHRVRREGWTRVTAGVWRQPGWSVDRRSRLSAALLAAGSDALATGSDGLWLHGLGVRLPPVIRLVVPMDRHAARHLAPHTKLISSRTLHPQDAGRRGRLACAVPARCLVDLVIPPTPPLVDVRSLLVTARQARLVTLHDLHRAIRRARGVPGLAVLRRAVRDVMEVDADSAFSDQVHRRLRAEGFRPDPRPAVVATLGRDLHPDITFGRGRVAVECDSMLAHSEQRDLMIDNRKDRAYLLAGWTPLRIGHLEFNQHWDGFIGDLRRAMAEVPAT